MYNFSSATIEQNYIYLTGGLLYHKKIITKQTFRYNITENNSEELAHLDSMRYAHTSIILYNHLFVIGGREFGDDDKAILNSLESLDLSNN